TLSVCPSSVRTRDQPSGFHTLIVPSSDAEMTLPSQAVSERMVPVWSDSVRSHVHVSVFHTFTAVSQLPEINLSPNTSSALIASWCPSKSVAELKEQERLRGLVRDTDRPSRPDARNAWCSNASISSLEATAPVMMG